jgi:colanic acid/amylovoran biosynthesis glycosyltransferase
MRVLHFCYSFSLLSETFIYDLVVELERQMGEQYVVTLNRQNEADRPFPRVYQVESPGRWHTGRLWHRIRAEIGAIPIWMSSWPARRARLQRVVQKVRPHVLHAHFGPEGALLSPVAERMGLPFITSFYGYDASRLLDDAEWRTHIRQWVFEAADTISLSHQMRKRLIAMGAPSERAYLVHLGKRLEEYPFTPSERIRRFLSVGRMTEKKGHLDTINAFASLVQRYPDAHLDVVGSGDLLGAVQDYVHARGLSPNVTLHGILPHDRVRELFRSSDAFVLCSKRAANGDCEGTPTVLLEAQATGLPCISTFHAGIPETIPKENHHLLAQEGDVQGITECMHCLLQAGPEEIAAIAERGRSHVQEYFNVETEAAKLRQLYSSFVGTKQRRKEIGDGAAGDDL